MTVCNKILTKIQICIVPKLEYVVDQKTRIELLDKFHNDPIFGGHLGKRKMLNKLQMYYVWNGMTNDVSKFVNNCIKCQQNKPKMKTIEPLQITKTPQRPFDLIVVDTIGPFNLTENNNKYAVTIVCNLSKFLITCPIPSKDARTVARAIIEKVILVYGPFREILTDRGTEYKNNLLSEIFDLLNIKHNLSTAYHHETVGSIERTHRVLNEYLRSYINDNQNNWDEYLGYFTYCYNTSPHYSFNLKYTPFEIIFGFIPKLPNFLQKGKIEPIYNFDSYSIQFKYSLQKMHSEAKKCLEESKQLIKKEFDKKSREINLKIGEYVLIKNEERRKFDPIYLGPLLIRDIKGVNVTIFDENKNKEQTVHKNRIIKFVKT